VGAAAALQVLAVEIAPLQELLGTRSLGPVVLLVLTAVAAVPALVVRLVVARPAGH
jgi:hypothetical protein